MNEDETWGGRATAVTSASAAHLPDIQGPSVLAFRLPERKQPTFSLRQSTPPYLNLSFAPPYCTTERVKADWTSSNEHLVVLRCRRLWIPKAPRKLRPRMRPCRRLWWCKALTPAQSPHRSYSQQPRCIIPHDDTSSTSVSLILVCTHMRKISNIQEEIISKASGLHLPEAASSKCSIAYQIISGAWSCSHAAVLVPNAKADTEPGSQPSSSSGS